MIRNIKSSVARDIYDGVDSRWARSVPQELHAKARRLLDQINAAASIDMLAVPPGNHLEKLRGDLAGYWSIRINRQWRIIFKWQSNTAIDVDIVDYHN
jgi:proteic killer suppression protein